MKEPIPIWKDGRIVGYTCHRGIHEWTSREDASKCCNGWRREQDFIKAREGFGITYLGPIWKSMEPIPR